MVTYYRQRASQGGLQITEATDVSPQAHGYPGAPGVYSAEQVEGWRAAASAVHARGGLLVQQLWHTGRISHSSMQPDGALPVAPSAIRPAGGHFDAAFRPVVRFETPRALAAEELAGLVESFRLAAANALAAGMDGVEVHGANGYLLDQFLQDRTNRRDDAYGGSIENRARLLLEVVDAVIAVCGPDRVGVHLSPYGTFNDMGDASPEALFAHVIGELGRRRLAYLHLIEPRSSEASSTGETNNAAPNAAALFRARFPGPIIGAGAFSPETAVSALGHGLADAVSFGRLFIANPDLPERIRRGAALNQYDRATFYGGGAEGYIDYSTLSAADLAA
jgi:N-ethylmaleimide reductase